jgi:hypothetical protein
MWDTPSSDYVPSSGTVVTSSAPTAMSAMDTYLTPTTYEPYKGKALGYGAPPPQVEMQHRKQQQEQQVQNQGQLLQAFLAQAVSQQHPAPVVVPLQGSLWGLQDEHGGHVLDNTRVMETYSIDAHQWKRREDAAYKASFVQRCLAPPELCCVVPWMIHFVFFSPIIWIIPTLTNLCFRYKKKPYPEIAEEVLTMTEIGIRGYEDLGAQIPQRCGVAVCFCTSPPMPPTAPPNTLTQSAPHTSGSASRGPTWT